MVSFGGEFCREAQGLFEPVFYFGQRAANAVPLDVIIRTHT
jgi:hypothetical protein